MFAPFFLFAGSQENPLVQAIKLFDQNKFQEAEKILEELITETPDNLMVNYFYGACRTENQHYGQKEILYLLKGSTGESPLKTDYYLGIQYHAQNRWDDALKYYLQFEKECTDEEAQQLKLTEKIQQCTDHVNPFHSENEEEEQSDLAPAPINRPEEMAAAVPATAVYPETNESDSIHIDSVEADLLPVQEIIEEPETVIVPAKPIEFVVNEALIYIDTANFQTRKGLDAFLNWEKNQQKLDSLVAITDKWRSDYAAAKTSSLKNELGQKIIDAESEQFALQKQTKDLLTIAHNSETDFWNNATEDELLAFSEKLRNQALSIKEDKTEKTEETDSALIPVEVFEDFVPVSPSVAQNEKKDELIYKIQIGAYSRGVPKYIQTKFDKLSYIRKIDKYTDERGVVVYTTGNLTSLEDAVKMQKQVRQEGIEDAFVVPYFNGKRITLEEAKKIEQQQ